MQGKLLVCSLFMSLIIFNVLAEDVGGDDDADLDEYQATLVDAAESLIKNFNVRDATNVERRGWFSDFVKKYIIPVVKKIPPYIPPLGDRIKKAIPGKRTADEHENLKVRDATNVERRGSFPDLVKNKYIPPNILSNIPAIVDQIKKLVQGKRTADGHEVLNLEVRGVNGTECAKDTARFKEIKQAAAKLCDLVRIPDLQCH